MFSVDTVKERLKSFGYVVKTDEEFALTFCVEKVTNTIKNETNQSAVPEGLEYIAVDMACGEFLFTKKQTGQLELGDLDLTGAITSIKEGDTQINISGESDDQKVANLINYLLNYGRGELVCYRKLRW